MRFKLLTILIYLSVVASEPLSSCACESLTPQEQFNHKADAAFQLGQGEIDRVRRFVERNHNAPDDLPVFSGNSLAKLPAPTATSNRSLLSFGSTCPNSGNRENISIAASELLKVDIDQDCKADFLLQIARTIATRGRAVSPKKFSMLIRVYSSVAEANISRLETEPIFLNPPSNYGENLRSLDILQEQERLQPLAVLQKEIAL